MGTLTRAGRYQVGDKVVYVKPKQSVHPGPRAQAIHPAPHGDTYSYVVDKYWIVCDIVDERTIVCKTRRGKTHRVSIDDRCLRKATWLERLLRGRRFPDLNTPVTEQGEDLTRSRS